ncbi:MAG: hypothetical protein U0360_03060 [Dehalococcoidia bacterium]
MKANSPGTFAAAGDHVTLAAIDGRSLCEASQHADVDVAAGHHGDGGAVRGRTGRTQRRHGQCSRALDDEPCPLEKHHDRARDVRLGHRRSSST